MNQSTAFRRKLIYLVILIATLVPLYVLGQPSDGTEDSGGQLAQMRRDFEISESDLGEISPASETMKLASLGLRGVAATLLWEKAHEYRVMHEWDRLKASLNNIALLQPHYDKVWEHQAHNLAYNVSIEFDDYRQRYEMVREGTEFLTRGVRQNRKAPRLIWYTGWFYGQKIGMSDEKRQFRKLFADDDILHASLADEGIAVDSNEALGPYQKPDNWLVGRLWLNYGYGIVDGGIKIRRQTPLNFYETGPKWSFKYAEAIEKEGVLDQRAISAWTRASENWERFGSRSIPTTSPFTIKLGRVDELRQQRAEKVEAFRALGTDIYDEMKQERMKNLPPDLQKVLDKAPEDRTEAGKQAVADLENYQPNMQEVVKRLPAAKQLAAVELMEEMKDLDARISKTEGYRKQINYVYWNSLALAEQEDRTVNARKLIYDAEKANADAEIDLAIKLYEEAFEIWAEIFDDYPILTIDDSAEDLFQSIRRYMIAIDSQELPPDFPLTTFAQMMNNEVGIQDAKLYERVRNEQAELARKRKEELAEEERRREAEGDSAEGGEPDDETKQSDSNAAGAAEPMEEAKEDAPGDGETKAKDESASNESADPEMTEKPANEDKSATDKPESDKPESDKPESDKPESGDQPQTEENSATEEKGGDEKTSGDEPPKSDESAGTAGNAG
ncbi:MAG: IRE (iron responsive element) [Planctomycetota bacterium]